MWKQKTAVLICASACIAFSSGPALAQGAASYPGKPIRLILPYAPGGGTSTTGRIFSEPMGKDLGQNVVVDNRPGGNTTIGTAAAARSAPDGYTLLLHTTSIALIPWMMANLPFNPLKDLTGVSTLMRNDDMIAVHVSVPANNLKELIAYAKANPGKINARMDYGATSHLALLLFMKATGTDLNMVAYKGSGSAVQDLLSGTVQFSFSTPSNFLPHIKAGKLKAIAVGGEKRNPTMPDTPTMTEQGLTNFDASTNWHMLLAPAGTPREILEKLNASVGRAQATAEVQDQLGKLGLNSFPNNVTATNVWLRNQTEMFGKVVKEHNIKPE